MLSAILGHWRIFILLTGCSTPTSQQPGDTSSPTASEAPAATTAAETDSSLKVAVTQPLKFEEDGKSTTDPHVWNNAQNGIKIAETIAANLEKLVPAQAATYKQNTQKLTAELGQLD